MRRLDNQAPFSFHDASSVLSAGVVVVRRADDGWRVLLLRVYNYWDFPKGRVEPGEDALTTARRETREETTHRRSRFRVGNETYIDTAPYGREKKVARYYVARTATDSISLPVNPELGKPEHHEWQLVRLGNRRR